MRPLMLVRLIKSWPEKNPPPDGWGDDDKPQGGSPDANDDLREAPTTDEESGTSAEGDAAPTN